MEPALIDHCDRLAACRSIDAVWAASQSFFASQGQPWVCHGALAVSRTGQCTIPDVRSNLPPNYVDRWLSARFYENDPLMKHISQSVCPGLFGPDYLVRERDGDEVLRFYEGIRALGAHTNITVPLRSSCGRRGGFIVLGGNRHRGEMERFARERGSVLVLAAHYSDIRLGELQHSSAVEQIHLSAREVECLEWLSAGLKYTRIAERMGISLATVRLHLVNARRKLKAATREQALAKAVLLGLVRP